MDYCSIAKLSESKEMEKNIRLKKEIQQERMRMIGAVEQEGVGPPDWGLWQPTVTPHMTVGDLKIYVYRTSGIFPEKQRWIYLGEEMEDDLTLRDYQLNDTTEVHLVLIP